VKREILMNTTAKETRVAILEDDVLVELMVERPDAARMVGDIYKGKVEAVLPGIQAAFVNIGTEKAAFLHVSDVALEDGSAAMTTTTPRRPWRGGRRASGHGGGKRGAATRHPDVVKKGQDLLVQVSKEPISTKGPRVTANISLPGRFLVYMPGSDHVGVSRKIEDKEERARLRALAREILPEKAGGVIVRTVGEELTRETFEREMRSLMTTWKNIQKKAARGRAPAPCTARRS
jgi:ribonuclease G